MGADILIPVHVFQPLYLPRHPPRELGFSSSTWWHNTDLCLSTLPEEPDKNNKKRVNKSAVRNLCSSCCSGIIMQWAITPVGFQMMTYFYPGMDLLDTFSKTIWSAYFLSFLIVIYCFTFPTFPFPSTLRRLKSAIEDFLLVAFSVCSWCVFSAVVTVSSHIG